MSPQDKAPAYQWYVRDYMSDEAVALMSYEQQGIYRALLDRQWLEGSIPSDPAQLAAILRVPGAKFLKLWPRVSVKFVECGEGRLQNRRMEREREKLSEFKEAKSRSGSKGAAKRWQKDGSAIDSPLANDSSSSATASTTATAVKSVEPARPERGRGAMGSSYLAASSIAYSHKGHTLSRGPHYDAFLERFDGDPVAFKAWLDGEIDAAYESGLRPGSMFKFIDERWEKRPTGATKQTVETVANLQAFVRGGRR